jgi:hypothetical protein
LRKVPTNNTSFDKYNISILGKTMKLTEFNSKPKLIAKRALNENFNADYNFDKLDLAKTKDMLLKVRGLIGETRQSPDIHSSEQNPAYLKLIFMEQALKHHYGELKALPAYNSRIVVENEGVEQAQVVLAAKDMIDSVQKMIEDISDMLVKELPAVVDSVNSEIGVDAGEQFNNEATGALSALGSALQQAKLGLQNAMNVVTGGGAPAAFGEVPPAGGMGEVPGEEMPSMDAEMPEVPEEEPEVPEPTVGRGKR